MIRKIIHIDQEACNGCGACAQACHEGAIGMVDGKATLLRDDYCDGLGDCLPTCPTNAISFVEREAAAYDEAAVEQKKKAGVAVRVSTVAQPQMTPTAPMPTPPTMPTASTASTPPTPSQLSQWPVQIKLAPINAPYFENANLLIAADCTAYAYGNFHNDFIRGKVTLIGCPKLDMGDYSEKLTEIISSNSIRSLTIVRMEVPCCGGIEHAAVTALKNSGKFIPWQVVTIGVDGRILD
ncbi:MAG: 4Fe-4S binding protein [Lachnospiraceae bacterium]|nr:4Fe-4S binding protein [Lachnospiraceae bacterium]